MDEEITLQFIPGHERTNIRIDPSHLDQIMANLAVNARDAINGSGLITIETSTIVINERISRSMYLVPGDYVVLTFSDNGSGIDGEMLKNIFDPFFTTKAEGKGTGLGLSTVYGIVKQNHGAIHVESSPGKGTCFRLYFPLSQEQERQTSDINVRTIPAGVGTILVVEDNDLLLNLVEAVLSAKGYRIIAAALPEEACRLCVAADEEIHLLLTDVVMPTMNGKELQRRIEALRPGIKTIFMSGYTDDIISARGVDQEEVNFLPKPFTMDLLQRKVHSVLYGEEPGGGI
jgi:CheY-like chemotaxis protein